MTLANKIKYAGAKPFRPEQEREDISHEEMEMLEQDETYQHLAEIRWLTSELEHELDDADVASPEVWREVFDAVGVRDAPLQMAVDRYVDQWLLDYRSDDQEAMPDV